MLVPSLHYCQCLSQFCVYSLTSAIITRNVSNVAQMLLANSTTANANLVSGLITTALLFLVIGSAYLLNETVPVGLSF